MAHVLVALAHHHLALVVLEEDVDLDLALLLDLVLDLVGAVVLVVELVRDLRVVPDLSDLHLEDVATRLSVLA